MGAMALLPICESSFTCEDYNTYRAHPWSPFPLRRAYSGPGAHRLGVLGVVQCMRNTPNLFCDLRLGFGEVFLNTPNRACRHALHDNASTTPRQSTTHSPVGRVSQLISPIGRVWYSSPNPKLEFRVVRIRSSQVGRVGRVAVHEKLLPTSQTRIPDPEIRNPKLQAQIPDP